MNQTTYTFAGYTGTLLPSGRVKWYGDDGTEYGTTRNAEGYEVLTTTKEPDKVSDK